MGWFEEQVKNRINEDEEVLSDSFADAVGSVIGRKSVSMLKNKAFITKDVFEEIIKYFDLKNVEIPDRVDDVSEQLDYIIEPYGIMQRPVKLTKGFFKDASGLMLTTFKETGDFVVLVPDIKSGSYVYNDFKTGKKISITHKNEGMFSEEAIVFYRPFPQRVLNVKDLASFCFADVDIRDIVMLIFTSLIISGLGLLLPYINMLLFGEVIQLRSVRALIAIAIFLICINVSTLLIEVVRTIFTNKIILKLSHNVQAATMMRLLTLPANFFRKYSSGELMSYQMYIVELCTNVVATVISAGLTAFFSLVYIASIASFAEEFLVPGIIFVLANFVISVTCAYVRMVIEKQKRQYEAKENGISYGLISGIEKIRLTGAEKRAFAKWLKVYSRGAELEYNPPLIVKLSNIFPQIISVVSTVVFYVIAVEEGVTVEAYYAFITAYGLVSGAFLSLASMTSSFANIKPIFDSVKPILDAEPEEADDKEMVSTIRGNIELEHVSFKYAENTPKILDDISFKIKAGQYVAIVGKTGCGKSTLMRLLLGFEKPNSGAIYYDSKDLSKIELKSLRKKIGVVMQNGKVFQGSIYENIVISAPELTINDAWDAARDSGLDDDINNMPMGMHTLITEGSGGISGGQRQRLMIARAIAPKPKILMFDEATSALDNITQRKVSDALDKLKCTRIVIAHRLSTIKQCDRIIVLDGGHIIEDGTYEQLIANNGFFAQLVDAQRLDK